MEGTVALVKEEADKVAQEIQTKGQQAVQIADEHLNWLKDSAEVGGGWGWVSSGGWGVVGGAHHFGLLSKARPDH